MVRKSRRNEWLKKPPTDRDIRDAQKLAKKVSKELFDLLEARTVEVKVVKGGGDAD